MKFSRRLVLIGGVLFYMAAVPCHADFDVEGYVQLTIARLEAVEAAWSEDGEPPPEEEIEALYLSHGTEREAYFCFYGKKRSEIEAYLEKHQDLREAIESTSAAIRQKIAEGEEE